MMNGNVGIRLRSPNCGDEPHSQSPSLPPLPDLIPIKKSAVNGKSRPFRNIKNTIGKKEPIDPFISYKDQRTSNTVTSNIVNSRNCNSCDATNLSSNSLLDGEYRWFSQLETIDDKIKIHEDENCNTELLESSSSVKKELSESYQDNSNSSSSSVNRCNGTKSRSESDNWSSMEDHKPTTFTSTIRLRKLPERIRLSAEAKLADRTARNRVHTQPFQSKPNEQSKLRRTKKDSTSSSKSTQPVLSNTNGNTDVSAVPRVNPIFLFVKQENTRIVDVRCEDYDKRNRIRLTKTESGWKAIPHINSNKTDRNALKIKHKKHKKCKKRFRSPSNNNNEAFNQNLTVTKSTGNHHQRSHHQEADNYGMGNTIYTTCSVDRQSIDESLLIRPRNKSTEKHKKKKKKKLKKCKTIHIKNENDIWRESGSTQSSLSNTSSPCFLIKDESGGLESSRYDGIKVKTHALIKKTTDEPEHPIHSDCQGDGNSLVSFLKEQYHQPNKQDQHHICNGNEEVERKIESRNVVEMHSSEKEDNNIIPTIENNHLNHSQQHNRVWQEQRRNATAPNALSCNITPTIEKIPGQELPAPNLSDNATTSTATGIKNENLINFLDSDCKIEYSDNLEQSEQYDINKLDNSSVLVGRVKEEYQVKPIQQIEHSENLGLFGYDNKMNVSGDNLCSTSALMAVTDKVATTLASNASIAVTQTSSVMVSSTPSGHHHHQQQQQQSNCIEFDGPNGVPTSSHIPDDYNEDDDIMLAAQPVADIISRLDDSSSTSCKELSLDGVSDIDHIVDPKLFDASGTVLNPDMISKTLSQLNQSMLDELSDTFKKFEKPETINSDDKMTTADELEQLQLDALEQRDTDTPRDLSCKKSEVPASKQTLMQSPRRPVSHSSDTIQSPQPSGLPAISLSPDIGLQYRNKSLSFTDLLSSSSSSSKVIDLADDICNKHIDSTNRINPTDYLKPPPVQNRGPIDLGKNRKSASPTVSCSEEVKYSKPNTQTGQSNQPLRSPNDDTICKSAYDMRRINSSQVTQSLPIDKDPDALTQFRLLTSNPEWKVPDPLVVPKDRLKAVLASPAREIPLLLMTRPELRLPEAFSFPRILQDPDILVISLQTLEAMLQKEQDQEFHKRQIPLSVNTSQSSSRPKSTSSEASSKPESLTSPDPKDRSPTGNSLACDIDSATMAAFHQMLLLPYLAARKNEYNPDLIKFMTELSNIGMANASLLSALKGNKEMESSNNIMQNVLPHTNPLEFAMWQQALANTNLAQLMKLNAERETREKKQQMQSSSSKSAQLADALNKPNRSLPMAYQLNLLQQQQHQQQQQQHQAAQLQAQQQQLLQQQLFQQQQQQQQHHQHQQQQKQQQAQAQAQQQQQQRINSMMNPFLMSPLFGGNLQNTPNMNSRGSQNMQSHQKSSPVATNPLSVENLTQLNPAWCRLDQNYMKNQRQLASAASASGKVDQQQALNNFHLLNRLHSEQMAGSSMNDKRQNSRPLTPPPQPTEEPKGRLTCKSLKNLLEPELLRNEMKEQTSKRRKLNEMPDYPPNPFMNPTQSVMGSSQRTKSKNSKSNIPMDPLMAHRQYMNPMLGMHDVRSAATNLGKMNEFMQQNPMAFHPFYNSPKPYNTPWEWNTVSAAGE